ncbi:MAG: hypothetical protein M0R46_16215 [Candidatus Muirbacterium halophilum]|nr:hypothetical protein [Candidatus Muirbacterium halophilum]MCK9477462.1 hypothetical protein [Candidatus Muirbacterium halophilum]
MKKLLLLTLLSFAILLNLSVTKTYALNEVYLHPTEEILAHEDVFQLTNTSTEYAISFSELSNYKLYYNFTHIKDNEYYQDKIKLISDFSDKFNTIIFIYKPHISIGDIFHLHITSVLQDNISILTTASATLDKVSYKPYTMTFNEDGSFSMLEDPTSSSTGRNSSYDYIFYLVPNTLTTEISESSILTPTTSFIKENTLLVALGGALSIFILAKVVLSFNNIKKRNRY